MNMFKKSLLASSISIVCSVVSAAEPAESADESVDNKRKAMEVIQVTAARTGKSVTIMETSFALTAISGDELEVAGETSVAEVLSKNPGVSSINFGGTSNAIQIRGISSTIGDATVGYYMDELPFAMLGIAFVPDVNPYDLDRIEVLRGPQGTLYGASSQGGTVRVLTKKPEHNEFSGKVTLGADSDNGWIAQTALNIPLVEDTLSARIVYSQSERDGFIDLVDFIDGSIVAEDYNETKDKNYRAKLLYTPTEELSIDLSIWHGELEGGYNYADDDYTYAPITAVYSAATFAIVGAINTPADQLRPTNEFDLYNFNVNYNFGDYSLNSSTSFMEVVNDSPQGFQTTNIFHNLYEGESLVEEITLTYLSDSPLGWTAGIFLLEAQLDHLATSGFLLDTGDIVTQVNTDKKAESSQQALFGEANYQFNKEWKLTTGLRYFRDQRTVESKDALLIAGIEAVGLENKRGKDFSKLTGRINLAYTPEQDSLYYLNIAQGFRSGISNTTGALTKGANGFGVDIPGYTDEEDLISYELGSKTTFLDDALAVELAAYYMDWSDLITLQLGFDAAFVPFAINLNLGDAKAVGLDFGLSYQATDSLKLSLYGNINKTEYQDANPLVSIEKGDQLTQVPEITAGASLDYFWEINDETYGIFYVGYQYVGEREDYTFFIPSTTSDSFGLLNARIGVEGEDWSVYLRGENLLDEDGAISEFAIATLVGVPVSRTRPRSFAISATYNF